MVANEACAAGLPVIVSPDAGVAGELVMNDANGYVRHRDIGQWAECAQRLLTNATTWEAFSEQSLRRVAQYNIDSAAQGLLDACEFALSAPGKTSAGRRSDMPPEQR